jgi:hypothetical protein
METFEALRDEELEVAVEIVLESEHAPEPDLDFDVIDDLDDAWFASEPAGDIYEIDPVHPLRKLSAWVRGRLAA